MAAAAQSEAVLFAAAELRLRKHADFQRVYNATKKQHAKQMSFFAAMRPVAAEEYAGPRVGLTVGKVMGKAHTRNRIKRRLREALRAEHAALGGVAVDVILHPRRTVETLPMEELRAEVAWVFRKVSKSASQRSGGSAGQQSAAGVAPVSAPDGRRTGGAGQRVGADAHGSVGGTHLSRKVRGEGGARSSTVPSGGARSSGSGASHAVVLPGGAAE